MPPRTPRSRALAAVRRRIDRLDEQLLRLVNQRARLALEIGRLKRRRKWPVFDPKREAFVLRHVMTLNHGPLSDRSIRKVFQTILTQCRRRERSQRGRTNPSV